MPGPSRAYLIAHYAFNTISLVVDSARKLGSLQAFGNPSQRPDGPWSGSQSAALTTSHPSMGQYKWGAGQYFEVNGLNLGAMSRTTGFSICTWFAFDATTMSSRIFDFALHALSNNIYLGRAGTSKTLKFYSSCGGGYNLPKPIINGKWRHVCVVNLGRNWSIYDDGALAASQTATCDLTNTLLTSNYIGRSSHPLNWGGDQLLVGRVDEFRIYDRALSARDVTTLYGYKGAESHLPAPLSLPPNAPSDFCP